MSPVASGLHMPFLIAVRSSFAAKNRRDCALMKTDPPEVTPTPARVSKVVVRPARARDFFTDVTRKRGRSSSRSDRCIVTYRTLSSVNAFTIASRPPVPFAAQRNLRPSYPSTQKSVSVSSENTSPYASAHEESKRAMRTPSTSGHE